MAAFALTGEVLTASTKKKYTHEGTTPPGRLDCSDRGLYFLGSDLFGHSLCGGNNAAVSHGRNAFFDCRRGLVFLETDLRGRRTDPAGVEIGGHHWGVAFGGWKRRCSLGPAMGGFRAGGITDQYRSFVDGLD